MEYVKNYSKMGICFLVGAFVTSTPALFFAPEFWIYVMGYGVLFALPALAVAMLLFGLFRRRILARPNLWCAGVAVLVAACVMGAIYAVFMDLSGTDLFVTSFVTLGSVAAAVLFRFWALSPGVRLAGAV